jgi:SAM-dependent methyltransferase
MKLIFSHQNPFSDGYRFDLAYVYEKILKHANQKKSSTAISILDYGANSGYMLKTLIDTGIGLKCIGVDVNVSALKEGAANEIYSPNITLQTVDDFLADKFGGEYDFITLMGVLEHVIDQDELIASLKRRMSKKSVLIISVPGIHFFSFADLGNWKFYFPKLHKYFTVATKGADYYQNKFVLCEHGLYGDIQVGKFRHEHFDRASVTRLLARNGLIIDDLDGYGFFHLVLHNIMYLLPKPIKSIMKWLIKIDAKHGNVAQLVLTCKLKQ